MSGFTGLIPNYPNRPPLPGWQDSDPLSHSIPAYFLQSEGGARYNTATLPAKRSDPSDKPTRALPANTHNQFCYKAAPDNSFASNKNHGWFAPFEYVPITACECKFTSNTPLAWSDARLH